MTSLDYFCLTSRNFFLNVINILFLEIISQVGNWDIKVVTKIADIILLMNKMKSIKIKINVNDKYDYCKTYI